MRVNNLGDTSLNYNFRFQTAVEVFEELPEISEDMDASPDTEDAMAYIQKLKASETPEEAITFLAYLLPARQAIWWAHESLLHAKHVLNTHDLQCLDLVEEWARTSSEENRNLALNSGLNSGRKSPGAWTCLAVGWSSGSMAEEDSPVVPVPAYLTPRSVNAAILMALAQVESGSREIYIESFVQIALMVSSKN